MMLLLFSGIRLGPSNLVFNVIFFLLFTLDPRPLRNVRRRIILLQLSIVVRLRYLTLMLLPPALELPTVPLMTVGLRVATDK